MRVGVGFTPFETRTDVIANLAGHAEDVGLERVDVAEGWTHDSLIILAELAARTSRIGLGTSIISVWGRTPATMALGAAGLQRCSGGRFSLGIGAGSPPLAEGFHGRRWDRPLARLRDTLTTVRALLAGDRLPEPAPGARALRLGVVPEPPVPILLAALSPGSVRLAAWWLSTYCTRMGPLYPRMLGERFGMIPAVEAVVAAADGKAQPDLPAVAEDLARDVTLFGTYDDAGAVIAEWFAAGADSINLVLPPGHPQQELAEFLDVASSVRA